LKAEGQKSVLSVRRQEKLVRGTAALLILLFGSIPAASAAPAATGASADHVRLELVLEPDQLPAADRDRFHDRLNAIKESIDGNVPLFRSFDPREVLADSLHQLTAMGVDLGESSDAILNFDSLEANVPAGALGTIEKLPWIRQARHPIAATPAGKFDSEALPTIGSPVANLEGLTGNGITVAIIDDGFNYLNKAISSCFDDDGLPGTPCIPVTELPSIPVSKQYRVLRAGTSTDNISLDATATQKLDGEHGTACAEVVYEVAPGVNFLLIGFQPQRPGQQYAGGVTSAQIQFAIRKAADLGAKVILVPMFIMSTMSDPTGDGAGGTNVYTDDVDYATGLGATVVVSAGNEDLRTVEETFTPCTDCTPSTPTPGGVCLDAPHDTDYHKWGLDNVKYGYPLDFLVFSPEVYDAGVIDLMACYTATDAADPTQFEIRMYDGFALDSFCDGTCPSDSCMSLVPGTVRNLNEGFSVKDKVLVTTNDDEHSYYIAVRRKSGTATPKIRVACTTSISEFEHPGFRAGKSLSDLAVLTNAVTVGAVDDVFDQVCDFDASGHCSSEGPTGLPGGPVKPDLVGPGYIRNNFSVIGYETELYGPYPASDEVFIGSSAAAAHVAGLAALLQDQAKQRTGSFLSPQTLRSMLIRGAMPLATTVEDQNLYGAGLAHIPDPSPGPYKMTVITPCRMFDSRTMPGPTGGPPQKLQGGVERVIDAAGTCGIPSDATAVAGIITIVSPSSPRLHHSLPRRRPPAAVGRDDVLRGPGDFQQRARQARRLRQRYAPGLPRLRDRRFRVRRHRVLSLPSSSMRRLRSSSSRGTVR
jgi:subtilisin family serine protease